MSDTTEIGVASNDVSSFFTMLTFVICFMYYAVHREELAADFYESRWPLEKLLSEPIKKVGQLGLLYHTEFSSERVSFNQTSEPEKKTREKAVVNFIRTMGEKHKDNSLPFEFKTTVISKAAGSRSNATQKIGVHNTECDNPQNSWWKAKYEVNSLFKDEIPQTRFLPMSFYMEATNGDGKRIVHYGAVKKLVIEADQDVLINVGSGDGVAYKMIFTLVDTNWENNGGVAGSGKNALIEVVASQQTNRCVFSAIVRDGKAYNVFISAFAFRLERDTVSVTDDVRKLYRNDGLTLAADLSLKDSNALALVRFHAGKDRMLAFLVRTLPLLDKRLIFAHGKENSVRIAGETPQSLLPLQVHISSTEVLDDKGNKSLSFPIHEILVRFNVKPRDPGDLRTDTSYVRAIQFKIPGNKLIIQDGTQKGIWYIDTNKLPKDTTVDLVVLSRTPSNNKFTLPKIAHAKVNGENKFVSMSAARYGGKMITLDKEAYERVRVDRPGLFTEDLRTYEDDKERVLTPGEFVNDRSWMVVLPLLFFLVIGWKFASGNLIAASAKMSALFCGVFGVTSVITAVAEHKDWIPENMRPYERIFFVASIVCMLSVAAAVLFSVRYSADISASTVIALISILITVTFIYMLEIHNIDERVPENVIALKIVSLVLLGQSLIVIAIEMNKLARKAHQFEHRLPPTISFCGLNVAGMTKILFAAGVVGGSYYFSYVHAPDSCNKHWFQYDRLKDQLNDSEEKRTDKRKIEQYRKELGLSLTSLQTCEIDTVVRVPSWLGIYTPVLLSVGVLALYGMSSPVAMMIRRFCPSKFSNVPVVKEEDGRTKRKVWAMKMFSGVFVTGIVLSMLYRVTSWREPICDELRNKNDRARDAFRTTQGKLLYNTDDRTKFLDEEMKSYGCSTRKEMSLQSTGLFLCVLVLAAYTAPTIHRLVPMKTSAIRVIGFFMYCCTIGLAAGWLWEPENREYLMHI